MKEEALNYTFDNSLTTKKLTERLQNRQKNYTSADILDLLLHEIVLNNKFRKDLPIYKYSQELIFRFGQQYISDRIQQRDKYTKWYLGRFNLRGKKAN
jgi:hypothetical protein